MKAAEILDALERIRSMVHELTAPDGTVSGVDHKLAITLTLCEELLQDGQERMKYSENTTSD